jgi:V/A-type H+-transporting ATPase subunit E
MGLEQVIDDIREEGEAEVEAIRAEAEEEAQALREDAENRAQERKQEILDEADDEAEAERQRIVANAQLQAKKKRLNAESDVLSSVRSRVESRLANLDEDDRRELIETYIEGSGADELGDGAKAWGRSEDQAILEDLGFTFEGEIDCVGGAVLESPEGDIREDLRFDEVLDEIWREEIHEIASDLLER